MKTNPFAATWITTKEERTPYVILNANTRYRNPERGPRLSKVVFRNDLTPTQALDLCTTTEGQVDLVTHVAPEDANKVLNSQYAKLIKVKSNRIVAGAFNRYRTDINFEDRNLRLAFNLAIDRQAIIEKGFKGYAEKVPALTPPWAFDFPEGLKARNYEPNRARKLLKEAGWPDGRSLRLATLSKYEQAAELIGSQINNALGIQVEVIVIPPSEEVEAKRMVAEKKLVPSWDILLADATALFYEGTPAFFHREFFGSDGALRMGPEIPEFNSLFKKMAQQTDLNMLLEAAREIDRYSYEEALGLFLCSPHDLYAVNNQVQFRPYRTTFELAETEVTESHWSRRRS
ncbi:ABC transporter substrate-binding protein [Pseudalkalibacillus decolorationis]|uniref:ABC transporter substrate-binding protein n=1 Tax=Pseudalkalibacillus decolorationis TaxID=163879 RepID=UPI002148E912|nr:ABC transporter substrate-binding protein [Pseudalkalibacillus decolorationis]